jgi:hypothetical protein
MTNQLAVNRSLLTMRYPFPVNHEAHWLWANGECMENSKWKMVNAFGGTSKC